MKTGIAAALIQLLIIIVLAIGWVKCVIKLTQCDFSNKTSYKAEVLYGLGTFTGLGGVIGYMDLGK